MGGGLRLGSLAGYPFEGPRLLAGWTAPAAPGVYAITVKPDPARDQHAAINVGHCGDLPALLVQACGRPVLDQAGRLAVAPLRMHTYEVPGGGLRA
jgi:hypothetical protein